MKIHTSKELLLKLTYLTLAGQDGQGELQWIGTRDQWDKVEELL
ncbi:hypothetical protein LCGC14_3125920 [marine sediment metagenome]|uniref:Uncharacterized protein n=1 Tax=marine sediment metagenome TaxID=412755 RepID=A0A0F8W163_9ZZZZ